MLGLVVAKGFVVLCVFVGVGLIDVVMGIA